MDKQQITEHQNTPSVNSKKGRKAGAVNVPKNSIKETLQIPRTIWEKNAGQPMTLLDLATKTDHSVMSSSFGDLVRSSARYGFTDGSWSQTATKTITLTSLGITIIAPKQGDNVNSVLRQALETPKVFSKFLSSINGKIIPPEDICKNTLKRVHNVEDSDLDACYKVIMKNIHELGIAEINNDKTYLVLEKLGSNNTILEQSSEEEPIGELSQEDKTSMSPPEPKLEQIPKVFISHSKNQNILEQLKTILEFGGFQYTIAQEVETAAIPIPDKIFGLMRECNCAIINVSADNEMRSEDDTYRINENVLIEIGASFVHYNKRVILLVDKRLKLPSNLQGLYRCEYDGDELSFMVAMKLQKALTEFKKSLN